MLHIDSYLLHRSIPIALSFGYSFSYPLGLHSAAETSPLSRQYIMVDTQENLSLQSADLQATFRPAQPGIERDSPTEMIFVAIVIAMCVYWTLIPMWPVINTHILGDAQTDAIRGVWGLDHLRRSLLPPDTPIFSSQINFPAGVTLITLPLVSGLISTVISFIFGPIVTWNVTIALIIWSLGMSTAWLLKQLTNSWAPGLLFGGLMTTQPMLLHAIVDGTPEHISLWGLPLFLGAMWKALDKSSPRWGVFAGILAVVVALDSPYHAIYCALASIFILPTPLFKRRSALQRIELLWAVGAAGAIALIGAICIAFLYSSFSTGSMSLEQLTMLKMNAVDLRNWWRHDFQSAFIRDGSLAPTAIPFPLVWTAFICILIGIPRSLPWLAAGLMMLLLSMGLNPRITDYLSQWFGANLGQSIGRSVIDANRHLYAFPGIGEIRFPQRWLVPGALMLFVGAGFGLQRIFQLTRSQRFAMPIVTVALMIGTFINLRTSRMDLDFPIHDLPKIQFASWLGEQPEDGAVLFLPQMRPPPKSGKRSDQPVFANLSASLASVDTLYFQVLHQRATFKKPSLKTLSANQQEDIVVQLIRNWDDLAQPMLSGNAIPPSSYDPRSERARNVAVERLRTAGLRWIVVDLGAYNDEALKILRDQIGDRIAAEKTFKEGDGVLILQLKQ